MPGLKDFDYWMEKTASEGRLFDVESFIEDEANMDDPTEEEMRELEEALKEKGFIVK